MSTLRIEILRTGWSTTLQDTGRKGSERLGVATGGAADQDAAMTANILVGNPRDAVLIETTGAGFRFAVGRPALIAVTGALAYVTVNGYSEDLRRPMFVDAGAEISIAHPRAGLRSYIAVHGAIRTPRFLGSAAPDARMGFDQKLSPGDVVEVDTNYRPVPNPTGIPFTVAAVEPPLDFEEWTVDVVDGPETAAVPGIRELLTGSVYTVGTKVDTIGIRLDGPVLHPQGLGEIVSHGVPIGAVEIPHDDELIVLGRARSLTAGYPIVAVATSASLPILGQAGPGSRIRFRWRDLAEARELHLDWMHRLRELERRITTVFGAVGIPTAAQNGTTGGAAA